MSSKFRVVDPSYQKITRGQFLVGPVGGDFLVSVGNCMVERQVNTQTADIKTVEDPMMPILARVTTEENETLKLTFKSWTALASAIAYMAPDGEQWVQTALTDGSVTIPAGAKDRQIYDFVDHDGNQVFGVIVSAADIATAGIKVDSEGGAFEVLGDRSQPSTFSFTCPAITPANKLGIYRKMQAGEVRLRARYRENNRYGRMSVHDWPVLSFRATGSDKLGDEANEAKSMEVEALVEYDVNAVGEERGKVRELNEIAK